MTNDEFGNGVIPPEDDSNKGDEFSGLGNLPPLSDFDSGEMTESMASDSGLPPLSSFDSDPAKEVKTGGFDGLPSFNDLNVETPVPAGGNIKPAPPGFEEFKSPGGQKAGFEKTGFQDIMADSDFSPATPVVGPGPDSDNEMDTPMLDSAFGAGAGGFSPSFETPAPTQAMETPLFGETPKPPAETPEPAFDEGAFSPSGGFDVGTPMPDFSPDTAVPAKPAAAPAKAAPAKGKKVKVPGAGGGKGKLATIGMIAAALVVGILAGPYVSNSLAFLPNPLKAVVAEKEAKVMELTQRVNKLQAVQQEEGKPAVSQEKIDELLQQQDTLTKSIAELTGQEAQAKTNLETTAQQLESVRTDLEAQNEEFVTAQEAYENLKNETSIIQARQMGLDAEVQQLTNMVGMLDEANQRSRATKDSLQHSIERMAVQIREGIPLTPEKFGREQRLAAVEELKTRVGEAKWVTPALLDAYTSLYSRELEIAESTAYFFAKIPVTSKLGDMRETWAECLMKGNNSVYYRSLDGKNVGIYQKVQEEGMPARYAFRENLPELVQKSIAEEVIVSRSEGFEDQLRTLAEKQKLIDGTDTQLQKVFNSLN